MIEKKPSRLSGSLDEDDLVTPGHDAHDDTHDGMMADDLDDTGDADADAEAMLARQKRNGMMVTYGTGAAFAVVVGLMAWPHFKHYFVKPEPVVAAAGTAVPSTVRKNFFADTTNNQNANGQQDTERPSTAAVIDSGTMGSKLDAPITTSAAPPPITSPAVPLPVPPVVTSAMQPASTPAGSTAADTVIPPLDVPAAPPSADIKALSDEVDKLKSDDDAKTAELDQLKTTVSSLQKQIADLATINAKPNVSAPVAMSPANRPATNVAMPKWQLRSVYNGSAILGRVNSSEMKHVSVGDMVTGLGKITSIQEQDGHWVVQATGGSVVQ